LLANRLWDLAGREVWVSKTIKILAVLAACAAYAAALNDVSTPDVLHASARHPIKTVYLTGAAYPGIVAKPSLQRQQSGGEASEQTTNSSGPTQGDNSAPAPLPANSTLMLQTMPPAAIVYVDGQLLGPTGEDGLLQVEAPFGVHSMRVVLDGYQDDIEDITLKYGETTNILVVLRPASAGAPEAQQPVPPSQPVQAPAPSRARTQEMAPPAENPPVNTKSSRKSQKQAAFNTPSGSVPIGHSFLSNLGIGATGGYSYLPVQALQHFLKYTPSIPQGTFGQAAIVMFDESSGEPRWSFAGGYGETRWNLAASAATNPQFLNSPGKARISAFTVSHIFTLFPHGWIAGYAQLGGGAGRLVAHASYAGTTKTYKYTIGIPDISVGFSLRPTSWATLSIGPGLGFVTEPVRATLYLHP
jgi:hypothetical protein